MAKTYKLGSSKSYAWNRQLKPRTHSGVLGKCSIELNYTDNEVVELLERIKAPVGVYGRSEVENSLYKAITGNERRDHSLKVETTTTAQDEQIKQDFAIATEFNSPVEAVADVSKIDDLNDEILMSLQSKINESEQNDEAFIRAVLTKNMFRGKVLEAYVMACDFPVVAPVVPVGLNFDL